MKRSLILSLCILTVLVFASCTSNNNGGTTTSVNNPFIGGTEGLLIDFQNGQPPREVFDGGEFPFAATLKIENRGEADIEASDMTVKLTGISASDFGLPDSALVLQPTEKISRRFKDGNGNVVEGSTEFMSFEDLNFVGTLAGNQEFTLRGEVCYKYKTKAVSKICITKDILDTTYDRVCRVDEAKQVHSSSAPIQVTNFRELPRGKDKVQFTFEITHNSNGDLFKVGTDCDFKFSNENRVEVNVDVPGMSGVKCQGLSGGTDTSGTLTVYNRKAAVTCTVDASGVTSDFEKIVNIELDYDFREFKETRLLVKHGVDE